MLYVSVWIISRLEMRKDVNTFSFCFNTNLMFIRLVYGSICFFVDQILQVWFIFPTESRYNLAVSSHWFRHVKAAV